MTCILIIDDEKIYQKMVANALNSYGFDLIFADNGKQGLEMAKINHPNGIITDVKMGDMDGFELTRLLRRELEFAKIPIIILTAQIDLQDKLKSFESGADAYLTKPFVPAELVARLNVLIKRAEIPQLVQTESKKDLTPRENGKFIALHSLRGGVGCSSLAVNLALGVTLLWKKPTLLLDLTMMAGQVALMLNSTLKRTWADIAGIPIGEMDNEILNSIITTHESGLSFIAAPTYPSEAETISTDTLKTAIDILRNNYQYILADLSHDFGELTIEALDIADLVLMIVSPDMASIRAAAAALDTYQKLNYPPEKIKLVLNSPFPKYGLTKENIETALSLSSMVNIPYTPDSFVQSINNGQPFVYIKPSEPISGLLEDFAFHISRDIDKKAKQENPTEAWLRVYERYQERRK
jgi:pilus assembly protein CpaE